MLGGTKYLFAACAAVFLLLIAQLVCAQSALPAQRIAPSLDQREFSRTTGNVHPWASAQNDRGAADPSSKLPRVSLIFQPSPAQQADLAALLDAQQNPASPAFHRWLSPQQYGERFGLASADLAKITGWLQSMGLTIVESPASRNFLVFEGTVAAINAAFHTEIHNFETDGGSFSANFSDPVVPAAFAGLVAGFRGLNSVRLQPRLVSAKLALPSQQPNAIFL